jgi:hypothetical protein
MPTSNLCHSCLQCICESNTLLWRRDSYSLSRKLYSKYHMVLEGVFLNGIGVFWMRETISRFSNTAAAVLVVSGRLWSLLGSGKTSSYLCLLYCSAVFWKQEQPYTAFGDHQLCSSVALTFPIIRLVGLRLRSVWHYSYSSTLVQSWGTAGIRAVRRAGRLENLGSKPGRCTYLSHLHSPPDRIWRPPGRLLNGYRRLFPQQWSGPPPHDIMACCLIKHRGNIPLTSSSFFFFFLVLTSFYLLIVGVDGYFCIWSHSLTHTLSRTPLDEGSARRRGFYLTTHNYHKTRTSMPPAGFEPAIPASERS